MRLFVAVAAVWAHALNVVYAQGHNPDLKQVLQNWQSVRISHIIDGGDHAPVPQFILLQRLDADRVILSSSEQSARSEMLPMFRAIISADDSQKLIEQALLFYAKSQNEIGEKARVHALPRAEEREEILKKHSFGMHAFYINIQVLTQGRLYAYQDDFSDSGPTFQEFDQFIMKPQSNPK